MITKIREEAERAVREALRRGYSPETLDIQLQLWILLDEPHRMLHEAELDVLDEVTA